MFNVGSYETFTGKSNQLEEFNLKKVYRPIMNLSEMPGLRKKYCYGRGVGEG